MENLKKITDYKASGWKLKFSVVLGLVLLGAAIYLLVPQEQKDAYRFVSEPLKKGDLKLSVSATGYLQPLDSVDVGSEVSGTVESVYVDYNDIVKKGQLLAQLNKTKYKSGVDRSFAALAITEATLQNAEATFAQAKAMIERDKTLRESTAGALPSQKDWESDWANYMSAKAQVANANAQIEQAKQALVSGKYDLERTMVYSPIDGVVLVRNIDPGQSVAASFQTPVFFKIAKDLTKMELQVSIDEADISKVKALQSATFSVDAYPERVFEGNIRLVRVNSEIVNGVVTYIAVLDVDNREMLLKPGMSADVDITVETLKNTLIVQRTALLFNPVEPTENKLFGFGEKKKTVIDSKPHVWVLENSMPKKVYVKILGNSGLLTAIVSDDIKESDAIIVAQEKSK
jgi:HlyD family secretion protein